NMAGAAAHFNEAERYASIVLNYTGATKQPAQFPELPRRRRSPVLLAFTAAVIAAVAAVTIIMFPNTAGRNNSREKPVVQTASISPAPLPVEERAAAQQEPALPPDSGAGNAAPEEPDSQKTPVAAETPITTAQAGVALNADAPVNPDTAAVMQPLEYGTLQISITPPDAQLFADEKPLPTDEAVAGIRMKTGACFIVAAAEGFEPYWGSMEIAADQTSTLSIHLQPLPEERGYLRVNCSVTASIYIDGVFRGTTETVKTVGLRTGEHFVTLKHKGRTLSQRSFTIDTDSTLTIDVK
ncbi:MAG: hypothetical protein JXA71_07060, partial [Chitinispirillaceae bacterium]|nr:hypothetical protein [Chitinispirillaceae bacterium]